MTITTERTTQGAWRVSAIVGDYLESRQFMGYTKEEAVKKFRAEFGFAPRPPKAEFTYATIGNVTGYCYRCDRDDIVALGDTAQEAQEKWRESWVAENA